MEDAKVEIDDGKDNTVEPDTMFQYVRPQKEKKKKKKKN